MRVCSQAERGACDANVLGVPVPMRRGGSESNLHAVDGAGDGGVGDDGVGLDFTKGALGIDSLQQKVLKVGTYRTNPISPRLGLVVLCRVLCLSSLSNNEQIRFQY